MNATIRRILHDLGMIGGVGLLAGGTILLYNSMGSPRLSLMQAGSFGAVVVGSMALSLSL